jgi:hypothetical protein
MTHADGRSQAEKRLGEAAAILRISRRWKAMHGSLFWKLKTMSIPGVEPFGKHHQGMALTIGPLRRQVTSPRGRSTLGRQGG